MAGVGQQAAAPGVRAGQLLVGGDVANVVNMFRGEVNMPVDLVAVAGRNGLDVRVTAFYGSGVHREVSRWNASEPTGVLGVGWSMPYEQILVEHQGSGTNLDNVFYLVTGGAPKQLVHVGMDGSALAFQLLDHQFWRIRYFPDAAHPEREYWEIVRDDGSTHTYGLGAVQWGVRWGNWIGPSTLANGVSFPVAWNLSSVRAAAGDTVSFEYGTDEVVIGAGSQAHYTRSCRLRRIVDVFGQTVEFTYLPKEPFEAPMPHVPPPGGRTAYQDRLEDHYLSRIDVRDVNGDRLLTTQLRYALRNFSDHPKDNAFTKRYLVAVRQEITGGASLPPLELDYHDATAVLAGALKSVFTPQGGRVGYDYSSTELRNSALRVPVQGPGVGWRPRVWHGPNYTVITWENSQSGRITTAVYSWNGSWSSQQDTHDWQVVPGTLRVLTGAGFFAIWYCDARTKQYRVNLIRGDEYRFGEWSRTPYPVNLGKPMGKPAVAVGAGFAAVADAEAGQLNIISWDVVGRRWAEHLFGLAGVAHVALSSGANFCIAAAYSAAGRSLSTSIYYGAADGRWLRGDSVSEVVDIDWNATLPERMLASGPSLAALGFVRAVDQSAQTVKYATRLLTWSTDYRFAPVYKADGSQPLAARNPVGFAVVNGSTVGNGEHLFRFDGARWQSVSATSPVAGPRYSYVYAADAAYAVTAQDNGQWTADLYEYDPYRTGWRATAHPSGSAPGQPTLAGDYRTAGRELLRRTPDGTWTKVYTLASNADLTTLTNSAPTYLTYEDHAGSAHVLALADGSVAGDTALAGERVVVADPQPGQILTGPDTFVTYRGPDFDKSTSLALYRVVGAAVTSRLVAYPVVRVSTDTGFQTQHTTLDYDVATATYDPYGLVTQFVTVRATPGDGAGGWVERVFFNGLSPNVSGVVYPPSGQYTNARNYFSRLNGQLFRTRGYDADGRNVSESVNYPYTYTSGDSQQRIAGAYTRLRRQTEATAAKLLSTGLDDVGGLDGNGTRYQVVADGTEITVYAWLETAGEYEYNSKGQLCREITENVDDRGVRRRLSRDTTYAWQAYQQLADLNCLGPVSQTTSTDVTAAVVTASTVITYCDTWGPWTAHRGFVWMGTGTPEFAGWEPEADPGRGWLQARRVLAVTDRAQPLAALDEGGHVGAVVYSREHRFAVATIANADPGAGEACYYGFEEYEEPAGWTLTPDGLDPSAYITEGAAHCGSRRLAIPGDPAVDVGITNEFTPAQGDRCYQLSCWVCTEPGFVSDPDLAAWRITVSGDQGTASIVTAVPATDDQWRRLHQLIDPQALGVGSIQSLTLTLTSRQDQRYLLVDDIAFAPVQASLRASVYSPDGQELRGTVDILGDSRRIAYDLLQRPVVEIGPDGSPLSMCADQLWRTISDSFDPADPNGSLMITLRGPGSFTDFRQGTQWQAVWQPSTQWRQTSGMLHHEAAGTGTLTLRETPHGTYTLRFGLAGEPQVTEPLRLTFAGWSLCWADGAWSLSRPDGSTATSSAGPAGTDLLLVAWPHRMLWYVDGQLALQHLDTDGFTGPVELACTGALTLRWIAIGTDPVVGISWNDNAGRSYQLERIADTRTRVSATGYDDAGRAAVTTKSIELDGEPVGYRPDLVTGLDPATGAMGDCELTRAYPDDEGYPFSRTVFEPSPLGRAVEAGLPGKEFAIDESHPVGQRHTARTEYRVNGDEPLLPDLPAGQYPVNVTIDPDGRTTRVWTDRLGQTVATAIGDLAGAPGTFALARNFHDPYGNVVCRHQPNMADTRVSDRDCFVERADYDFLGNPLSITGPDLDGSAEYVYDTLGRPRFSRLPQAAAEGYLCYLRYDGLGRVVEEGTCVAGWDRGQLQEHADDPQWLPAAGTWLARYRYDGDGGDPRLYGRLWQAWSGPATGDTAATCTTYTYDDLGLVTSQTVAVAAYADGAPQTVAFGHDATGAVTRITYDAQLGPEAFTANLHTDGFNDLVAVSGDHAGQTTELARFSYTADGALTEEVLAPQGLCELTRRYSYTPPGWLASVSDPYLTEATDYTTGGRAARVSTLFTGVSQEGFVPAFDYRYGYDALGRLAKAENNLSQQYCLSGLDYDANGNLIARTVGGVRQQLLYQDGTNRLLTIDPTAADGPAGEFSYDSNGQVTDATPLGVSALRYEPISGLPAGLHSAAGRLCLQHDAAGTLLYRAGPDGQRLYVSGPSTLLTLHHSDTSGGHRVGYLIPGPHGPVAVWSPQGVAYVLRGRLDCTRAVYDGTGLIGAFNYLPDGGYLGAPLDRQASIVYPFLFAGAERDPVTGLYLFPQRIYDPVTGRFLSTDPAGQFASPYLYVGGDPVNGYDPSGGFAWSWSAFGVVVGGILAIAGGVALTVATGGLAAPAMIAGAMIGGALIGAGIASAAYGFGHANAAKQNFDWAEWGIMVGLGAAFGAAAAGLGFIPAVGFGTNMLAVFGYETTVGTLLGALDGVITNGALNTYHHQGFEQGWGPALGFGIAGGVVGGAVGGALGRSPMLLTNRTVRAGLKAPAAERGQIQVGVYRKLHDIYKKGHAAVGTETPGTELTFTHLEIRKGGGTKIRQTSMEDLGPPTVLRAIDLRAADVARASAYAERQIESNARPAYSYFREPNYCTTYIQKVLREADLYPPLWTVGPIPLRFWLRSIGRRLGP